MAPSGKHSPARDVTRAVDTDAGLDVQLLVDEQSKWPQPDGLASNVYKNDDNWQVTER